HSPFAHVRSMQEDDFGWAEGRLEGLEPGDVLLAVEPYSHATWLSYRGRQHRIWLLGDLDNLIPRPVPPPDGPPVYLLVEETLGSVGDGNGQGELLARRGRFALWRWHGVPALTAAPPP